MKCPYCNALNSVQLIQINIKRNFIEDRLGTYSIVLKNRTVREYTFYKCKECKTLFKTLNFIDLEKNKLKIEEFLRIF